MNRRVLLHVAGLVCAALVAAGCGVVFGGTHQAIRASSNPDGVTVATNPATGDLKTPVELKLSRKQQYALVFSMPGYTTQQVQLKRSMRKGIVTLDIVTCCLSVIVDAVTGGWYKLSPADASVSLSRTAAGPGPDSITVTLNARRLSSEEAIRVDSTLPGVSVAVRPESPTTATR